MKITILTLISSVFLMSAATAQTMTTDEVLSAIDGEYSNIGDSAPRVNFDLSIEDTLSAWRTTNTVLTGIDGEYSAITKDTARVNYSISSFDLNKSFTDEVLSGVDGEYSR